jgi:TPP-dependent pyruvate/acetoin dehydrogenase alpha subunit
VLKEQAFMDLQASVREQVRLAVEFAENSPIPEAGELYTDVLLNPLKNMSPTRDYTHGAKNPLM